MSEAAGDNRKRTFTPATTEEGAGAGSALDRLKAARGKTAVAPETEDDSPAEVAAAADAEVEVKEVAVPEEAGETQVSDLAAKIKARVGKKSA